MSDKIPAKTARRITLFPSLPSIVGQLISACGFLRKLDSDSVNNCFFDLD